MSKIVIANAVAREKAVDQHVGLMRSALRDS